MTDYDSPWKEALAFFFAESLEFYFPVAHAAIDWNRGCETLDKELQQVIQDSESGRRFVDHLVKAWLKNGSEEWLLVHVEVQTQQDSDFAKRLYTYNYRLFDRYHRNVVTLALLADDRESWRPSCYEFALWDFRVRIDFPIAKLLDLVRDRDDLETNPNPFAALTLAHVRTLQTRDDPEQRRLWKFRLVKSLYQRGLSGDAVRKLFRCIDWMMNLPRPMEDLFWDDVNRFERENKMPYIDLAERKGMEKGMVQGLEKGMVQGLEKGTVQTLIDAILLDWEFRFSDATQDVQQELRAIDDQALLKQILRAGKTTGTLDELRKLWKTEKQ